MKRLKTGVIGLGRMGQHHCRVYSNLREAQLVGVHDINPEAAKYISRKFEVPEYHRLDDLLDQVDAVSIATPTSTHYEIAMKCLIRKIHVLVEKPVTDKIDDAIHLAEVVDKNRTVIQVGHIERFNPTYVELKKVLEPLKVIAISFRRLSPYRVSNKDVDVVLDLMVHDLDLCNDLFKREPLTISAHGLMPFSNSLDHVVAQLFYKNGPLITLTASRVTEQKIRSVDVTAEDAFVEADFMNKSIYINRCSTGEYSEKGRNGVSYHQESTIERILVPNVEPLSEEIKSFLDSIYQNHAPCVSINDGITALRIAQQISSLAFDQNPQFTSQNINLLESNELIHEY